MLRSAMVRLIMGVFLISTSLIATPAIAAAGDMVDGIVEDADGTPIAGATVCIVELSLCTTTPTMPAYGDGYFHIDTPDIGNTTLTLSVSATDYQDKTQPIEFEEFAGGVSYSRDNLVILEPVGLPDPGGETPGNGDGSEPVFTFHIRSTTDEGSCSEFTGTMEELSSDPYFLFYLNGDTGEYVRTPGVVDGPCPVEPGDEDSDDNGNGGDTPGEGGEAPVFSSITLDCSGLVKFTIAPADSIEDTMYVDLRLGSEESWQNTLGGMLASDEIAAQPGTGEYSYQFSSDLLLNQHGIQVLAILWQPSIDNYAHETITDPIDCVDDEDDSGNGGETPGNGGETPGNGDEDPGNGTDNGGNGNGDGTVGVQITVQVLLDGDASVEGAEFGVYAPEASTLPTGAFFNGVVGPNNVMTVSDIIPGKYNMTIAPVDGDLIQFSITVEEDTTSLVVDLRTTAQQPDADADVSSDSAKAAGVSSLPSTGVGHGSNAVLMAAVATMLLAGVAFVSRYGVTRKQ